MWNNKQKYAYAKIMNGLRRSSKLGKKARHLVLTTSNNPSVKNNSHRMYEDYKELQKRIRRITPLKLVTEGFIAPNQLHKYYPNKPINQPLDYEYHRVRTNEVNGVLHIIQVGDFIPYHWLVNEWDDIHYSPNISITEISNDNYGKRAWYVVSQYVSNQKTSYVRSSMSKNFIYPNWLKDYNEIRNHVYHFYADYKQQHFKYGMWLPKVLSVSKYEEMVTKPPPNQTQLYPVELPNDKQLFLNEWNKHLDKKIEEYSANKN